MDSCSLLNSETDSADTHIRLGARLGFRIQPKFWQSWRPAPGQAKLLEAHSRLVEIWLRQREGVLD